MDDIEHINKMNTRVKNGISYRSLTLSVKTAEDEKESYIVEGYAATFNEPYLLAEDEELRLLELVEANAFIGCEMSDVIFQYDHEGRVFARTANKTLDLHTDEHGLFIRANLGGTEEGRKLYEEIRGGYISKMSFGFTVKEDDLEEVERQENKRTFVRKIKSFGRIFDVSAVSLPANDGTEISARSYFETEVSSILKAEAEKRTSEEAQKKAEEEARIKAEKQAKELKERERLALELSFTL